MAKYANLSTRYYQETKKVGLSLGNDLEFYEKQFEKDDLILEAGVGTGRLLIPYLKKSYKIEGIDLSEEMLSVCNNNMLEHGVSTQVFQGDVATFDFKKTYDKIIVPTGTFCLFNDITAVLSNFNKSLEKNGKLIFDIIYPFGFKENTINLYPLQINDKEAIHLYDHQISIDWIGAQSKQILEYRYYVEGELMRTEMENFDLNWYGLKEINYILQDHGFIIDEKIGDYAEAVEQGKRYETVTIIASKI